MSSSNLTSDHISSNPKKPKFQFANAQCSSPIYVVEKTEVKSSITLKDVQFIIQNAIALFMYYSNKKKHPEIHSR